jgi:hypothetical protein
MNSKHTFYPLGEKLFASVKTYKKSVFIYLCIYRISKTGRIFPSTRISMTHKQFCQLFRVKDKLAAEYNKQMAELHTASQVACSSTPTSTTATLTTPTTATALVASTPSTEKKKRKKKKLLQ